MELTPPSALQWPRSGWRAADLRAAIPPTIIRHSLNHVPSLNGVYVVRQIGQISVVISLTISHRTFEGVE